MPCTTLQIHPCEDLANLVTDTQAAIFRDDNAKELIQSFPGTASVEDFVTDFSFIPLTQTTATGCTNYKVHGGFYVAWRTEVTHSDSIKSLDLCQRGSGIVRIVPHWVSVAGCSNCLPLFQLNRRTARKCLVLSFKA